MKKRRYFYLLLCLLIGLVTLDGCKKCPCQDPSNPECENYDPCLGKRKINTWFRMKGGDNGFGIMPDCGLIDCDTWGTNVLFIAPTGNPANSSYIWNIGSDNRIFTKKEFQLSFKDLVDQVGYETIIPITLTIRTPYNGCMESAEDTLVTTTRNLFITNRTISVFDFSTKFTSVTKFKGYFKHEPHKEALLYFIRQNLSGQTNDNLFLVSGYDVKDSIRYENRACGYDACVNLKHRKFTFKVPDCDGTRWENYTAYHELYLDKDKLFCRRDFVIDDKTITREFIGTKAK